MRLCKTVNIASNEHIKYSKEILMTQLLNFQENNCYEKNLIKFQT